MSTNSKSLSLTLTFLFLVCIFIFPKAVFAVDVFTWTTRTAGFTFLPNKIDASSDGTKVYMTGAGGVDYLYLSTDSGATWVQSSPAVLDPYQIYYGIAASTNGSKLIVGTMTGNGADFYTSTNSGVDWTGSGVSTTGTNSVNVASSDDGTHLAAVDGEQVYTSSDSGATWTTQCDLENLGLTTPKGIAMSSDGLKLAALSNGGYIYTSSNGYTQSGSCTGSTWTQQTGSGSRTWNFDAFAMSADGTKLVAAVNSSTIYTSSDSGVTWSPQAGSGSRIWRNLSMSSDGRTIIAIAGATVGAGIIYVSVDSGVTWNAETTPGTRTWKGVHINQDGTKIVASFNNTTSIYTATYTPTDSTAPSVSMTAPSNGATVSGSSVSLTATASDDTAVSGVQFKLDTNTNIGAEDTTSTYGVTWDSTAVSNGSHTLHAVARDAAGNYATSTITVTVANDSTGPVASSIAASSISQSGATITWTSNEGGTSQVQYGQTLSYGNITNLDSTLTTSHSVLLSGLMSGVVHHYTIVSKDTYGNYSTSSDQTFTTSASSGGSFGGGSSSASQSSVNTFSLPPNPIPLSLPFTLPFQIPSFTTNPILITSPNLQVGNSNVIVKSLQQYLNTHNFPVAKTGVGSAGNETTTFGALTKAALIKFQASHGIPPTGYFGPITKAYIASHP